MTGTDEDVALVAGRLSVHQVMRALSGLRPVFHSEADLQHAFGRMLWEVDSAIHTRLEARQGENREYLDLLAIGPEAQTAIEFKYWTRDWVGTVGPGEEEYSLRNHSATDLARRNFVFDIERLERFAARPATNGLAVMLTNEPSLWSPPRSQRPTRDRDFRLHENRVLSGTLLWGDGDYPLNTRRLSREYPLRWRDYSDLPGAGGKFRYLAVEIRHEEIGLLP